MLVSEAYCKFQVSQFGGSAWEWSDIRQQYYLHQFAVSQADFNFRNQAVKDEMINIMRFWLNKVLNLFSIKMADSGPIQLARSWFPALYHKSKWTFYILVDKQAACSPDS